VRSAAGRGTAFALAAVSRGYAKGGVLRQMSAVRELCCHTARRGVLRQFSALRQLKQKYFHFPE